MKKLTMGGLFEGIGGFPLAATWVGIEPIWSNEIDPWCCKILRKNFDHEIIEKDIRFLTYSKTIELQTDRTKQKDGEKINKRSERNVFAGNDRTRTFQLKPVDILTGGFPCQPFSHAGKRKGKDDNRYLWPEYLRLIGELQPTWIIAENVAGLISMENGRTLEGILIDLENENYTPEIYNIPACGVGAWHKRERIWIVCHSKGKQGTGGLLQSNGQRKKQPRGTSLEQDVSNSNSCNDSIAEREEKQICERTRRSQPSRRNWWSAEPNVGRVADGIPGRVDRLKGLGNAIVPQVAYEIFKAIVEYENNNQLEFK